MYARTLILATMAVVATAFNPMMPVRAPIAGIVMTAVFRILAVGDDCRLDCRLLTKWNVLLTFGLVVCFSARLYHP